MYMQHSHIQDSVYFLYQDHGEKDRTLLFTWPNAATKVSTLRHDNKRWKYYIMNSNLSKNAHLSLDLMDRVLCILNVR